MADSVDSFLACQICLEDFEESGDHVPRLLPCTHTLCEKYLRQLVQGTFVECPQCRQKHRVVNDEVRTFPQNKYILVNVRKKQEEIVKNEQKFEAVGICELHGKELILYCKGPECLTKICQTCLTRNHRGEGHDVVETEEREKEALQQEMEMVIKCLQDRKKKILEADNKNSECVQKIRARKDKLIEIVTQRCDQLLEHVNNERRRNESSEKLMVVQEHLDLLRNLKENVDKEGITHEEMENNRETVVSIQKNIPGFANAAVCEFQQTESTVGVIEKIYGHLKECGKEILYFPQHWRVTWNERVGFGYGASIAPVGTSSIAIQHGSDLIKFEGMTGKKLQVTKLKSDAENISAVKLSDRACVAVHFSRCGGSIEFRDVKNFNTVVYDYPFYASQSDRMYTSPGTALWFVCYPNREHIELQRLECSSLPLPNREFVIKLDRRFDVRDMHYVQLRWKSVIVLACGIGGVRAYSVASKSLEWSVNGTLPEVDKVLDIRKVTADENCHVFVLDCNNKSVHMLSVDGKYIITILRKGEQGLGELNDIRWSEGLSGLIVLHRKDGHTSISLVKY